MTKPEHDALPADLHYEDAKRYETTRMNFIQVKITERCLAFLDLREKSLILDIGCGTGMSGRQSSRNGHEWVGCDISKDMLMRSRDFTCDKQNKENCDFPIEIETYNTCEDINREDSQVESACDIESDDKYEISSSNATNCAVMHKNALALICCDIGANIPFKPASFDAFISVSCFQWLFHNKSLYESRKIVKNVCIALKSLLKYNGKGVIQFYPIHSEHTKIILDESMKVGFLTNLIEDGNGSNKKYYITFDCQKDVSKKIVKKTRIDRVKRKIEKMKERRKKKGLPVSRDSKYTGRKRCKKFF